MSEAGSPKAASPKPASLWAYALEVYGRPGAEARFLALQDGHGQNVCFLIWSLWMAAEGRAPDAATCVVNLKGGPTGVIGGGWMASAAPALRSFKIGRAHV